MPQGEVFSGRLPSGVSVEAVENWLRELSAAEDDAARTPLLRTMLAKLSGIEAQYVVRITDGGMDVGLDQALVAEAVANAFHEPLPLVREAMKRLGDIGTVAERARLHRLAE
jgi:ATP-dependent DNA ligase